MINTDNSQIPVKLLKDIPKNERRQLVIEGNTTAGPLAVFMYKYPIWSGVIGIAAISAFLYGCWTCIQM